MSAAVLTPGATGFFGKLPVTGDFVSRGLPDVFRQRWDAWVTRYLAPRVTAGGDWPEGGLRFRIVSGGRAAAGVVLSGADSAGRPFPLSLIVIAAALPGPTGIDDWCEKALAPAEAALAGRLDADGLQTALEGLLLPAGDDPVAAAMLIWTRAHDPEPCLVEEPAGVLDRALAV